MIRRRFADIWKKLNLFIRKRKAVSFGRIVFPKTIFIETTTKCNLQCTYCLRTEGDFPTKNKIMAYDDFQNILNKIAEFLKKSPYDADPAFYLHGFGEPTLNNDLEKMILLLRSTIKNAHIRLVSNLSIKKSDDYKRYINLGVNTLYVSIDSIEQEIAEKTRKNINIQHLLETLEGICRTNAANVAVITVLTEKNVDKIKDIYEYIKNLGIKTWNVQLEHVYDEGFNIPTNLQELRQHIGTDPGIQINFEEFPMPACTQPFDTLVVNVAGEVVPCCSDTTGRLARWGNVHEAAVSAVFHGERAVAFRKAFISDKALPAICKNCPYKGTDAA